LEPSKHFQSINPAHVDWSSVRHSAFLLHQHFRYEYPSPIRDLKHKLVVVPPEEFGNQRLRLHRVEVSEPGEVTTTVDSFANTVIEVTVPRVDSAIEFESWVEVERSGANTPRVLPETWLQDPRLLDFTALTSPDDALKHAADELDATGATGLDLAEQVNKWVHRAMTYSYGVTGVRTSASQALAAGSGVCQDYAHVMLSICRLLRLPSLYVSGHLLGEGGTHAWVEVLLPGSERTGEIEAWALDPTHGRRAGPTYVTVAVGRDYADVAPTSGSYRARVGGSLSSRKQVHLTEIAYND
jgi:transglutaminase-like putative cysteine protease